MLHICDRHICSIYVCYAYHYYMSSTSFTFKIQICDIYLTIICPLYFTYNFDIYVPCIFFRKGRSLISFSFKVKNLQEKWRDMFALQDVNNDSLLDMDDVSLSEDNYVRLHNLTEVEVCEYRMNIHDQNCRLNANETLVIFGKNCTILSFLHSIRVTC